MVEAERMFVPPTINIISIDQVQYYLARSCWAWNHASQPDYDSSLTVPLGGGF
jgi:hypothetical protein